MGVGLRFHVVALGLGGTFLRGAFHDFGGHEAPGFKEVLWLGFAGSLSHHIGE